MGDGMTRKRGLRGCGAQWILLVGCSALIGAREGRAGEPNPFLGGNLLSQGRFEEWNEQAQPEGWTVAAKEGSCEPDNTLRAEGAKAARLSVPKSPGYVQLTSPKIPAGPGPYLVRFTFRVEGLARGRAYEGGQADGQIFWLGEGDKTLRHDYVAFTYFPLEWSYRDRFCNAPPGTTAIRVSVGLYCGEKVAVPTTAWFDDVAVCSYRPPTGVGEKVIREWSVTAGKEILKVPDAPAWFYLSGAEGGESAQAEWVRDGDAFLGAALHAKPEADRGIVFHSPYTVEQPPGLYRIYFRMKVPPVAPADITKPLADVDVDSSAVGQRGSLSPTYAYFRTPGTYEDVTFDFIKQAGGWLSFRVFTPGKGAEFWLDHVRVVQLRRFSDPDLLAWYPGIAGSLGAKPTLERGPKPHLLLVEGLLAQAYRLDEALAKLPDCEITRLFYSMGQIGGSIEGYPMLWRDLRRFSVVVLANGSLEGIGPEQRLQLAALVKAGGGLLLLGGKAAYGSGGVRNSFLEEILPVSVADSRFDIVPAGGALVKASAEAVGNPKWPTAVVCPFVHQIKPRPGATVAVTAGKAPFLLVTTVGEGRVACVVGTPYGAAPEGKQTFLEWPDWPLLLRNVLLWLGQGGTTGAATGR